MYKNNTQIKTNKANNFDNNIKNQITKIKI